MESGKLEEIYEFLRTIPLVRNGPENFDSEAKKVLAGVKEEEKVEILEHIAQSLREAADDEDYFGFPSLEAIRFMCFLGSSASQYIPLMLDVMLWDGFNGEAVGAIRDSLLLLKNELPSHAKLLKEKLAEQLQRPEFSSPDVMEEEIRSAGSMLNQFSVFSRPDALAGLLGQCGEEAGVALKELRKWVKLAEKIGDMGFSGVPPRAREALAAAETGRKSRKKPWW